MDETNEQSEHPTETKEANETREAKPRQPRVMVLAGGPDRERPVSIQSGQGVAEALDDAGYLVVTKDVLPSDLLALDAFVQWQGDVIFPVLHGKWGEGGGLQEHLDTLGLPYIGSQQKAATICMDKVATKQLAQSIGIATPAFAVVEAGDAHEIQPPVVVKPIDEGSSIDLRICLDRAALDQAREDLHPVHGRLLIEQYVKGYEVTVALITDPKSPGQLRTLPPIQIVPATAFYDYEAKYVRDDTQYRFDTGLPEATLETMAANTLKIAEAAGVRHLARVDYMVDAETDEPLLIEVNTLPGFTSHSLVPMAAKRAGISMPALCDLLCQAACQQPMG